MPSEAQGKPGDRHYRHTADPYVVLEALLIWLWFDTNHRLRKKVYHSACPPSSVSRALRRWTPDPKKQKAPKGQAVPAPTGKNSPCRRIWSSYMRLLEKSEREEWRRKLNDQANSWRDWKQASRLAIRVHSPWFRAILDETNRPGGRPF